MGMKNELTTVLTERGQISVPVRIRRRLNLKTGQRLLWQPVSESTLTLTVLPDVEPIPGPLKVLGWAKRFARGNALPGTDDAMRELREGERIHDVGD